MNCPDRKLWAAASSLADLGELTAQWLEGGIDSQPGYAPGCGPSDETTLLIPVLAAVNRAGFLTDCSQPGLAEVGYDGAWWEQRAAVEGYASPATVELIRAAVDGTGLILLVQDHGWRISWKNSIPVTHREGHRITGFGTRMSRRHLYSTYGECGSEALRELDDAQRVTIVDPEWGREDSPLWPALVRFTCAVEVA